MRVSRKVKCSSVFCDVQQILLLDSLEVRTINATVLRHPVKIEGGDMEKAAWVLKSGILFWGDNASPHSVMAMQNHIATLAWECLYHSPDFTPSNFLLFLDLKNLA
ncbi:hypothetical protein TNCV_1340381 [Trichonephila clavipes]|nr:hypothetical protein TNCV_1340381 [Trichonephila clavipes]